VSSDQEIEEANYRIKLFDLTAYEVAKRRFSLKLRTLVLQIILYLSSLVLVDCLTSLEVFHAFMVPLVVLDSMLMLHVSNRIFPVLFGEGVDRHGRQ
jgi:hypothetical protein